MLQLQSSSGTLSLVVSIAGLHVISASSWMVDSVARDFFGVELACFSNCCRCDETDNWIR